MGTWIYFREGKAAKGEEMGAAFHMPCLSETVVLYMPLPLRSVETMGSFIFYLPTLERLPLLWIIKGNATSYPHGN